MNKRSEAAFQAKDSILTFSQAAGDMQDRIAEYIAVLQDQIENEKQRSRAYKRELKSVHRAHRLLKLEYKELERRYNELMNSAAAVASGKWSEGWDAGYKQGSFISAVPVADNKFIYYTGS